ncbi:MAG: YciI family protein [Acidimicrobiia bacterium]|nr:YciI family protein [Acidimicrobiia bacterium]
MRYMLLIYTDPNNRPDPGGPEAAAEMPRWFAYTEELQRSGALLGGEPLHDVADATTVRVRGGETITTDGPFAETKETLGGYYMIDVDTLDEAIDWAAKMPHIDYGTVEVRPIMELPDQG